MWTVHMLCREESYSYILCMNPTAKLVVFRSTSLFVWTSLSGLLLDMRRPRRHGARRRGERVASAAGAGLEACGECGREQ